MVLVRREEELLLFKGIYTIYTGCLLTLVVQVWQCFEVSIDKQMSIDIDFTPMLTRYCPTVKKKIYK
jgi:hypothetical protein